MHTCSWDAFGNATTIDGISITYDAFDRMVEQSNSGSYKQFTYSPTGFKMQIMNGATTLTSFVPLPSGASIVYIASGYYFRHADWLGSSRFSSTSARAMYSDKAYAPFGEPYAQAGTTTDLNFTGMNSDTSSGLYDFPAREYSTQGRWPRPDPAGLRAVNFANPQTWNRYAYVANQPMSFVDPQGTCRVSKSGLKYGCVTMAYGDPGDGDVQSGNDIFDAIEGSPGTYLTLNTDGRMTFGFSPGLYTATQNFIDDANALVAQQKLQGCVGAPIPSAPVRCSDLNVPDTGYQVFVHDLGNEAVTSGFIPELSAAALSGFQAAGPIPAAPGNITEALAEVENLETHGNYSPDDALAIVFGAYPSFARYEQKLQQWYGVFFNPIMQVYGNYSGLFNNK